ncbi:hypothetical protein [Acaryochloris marina]|uniref:Uncharacterized protein n=1 Tax=Acaryochloris marina (strain MBIC 11017) TaxID=329726 RepID=B0C9B2_ACAM1|nr:hypothetical protein [Acaryochloris marina]ABW27793.1 hypothetical protein AM1_2793 [Acaryochloris marina MBIC11017]BDM82522.1 hypothetical protein AM10699_53830 [Acaryochloris marina MBIC10699]
MVSNFLNKNTHASKIAWQLQQSGEALRSTWVNSAQPVPAASPNRNQAKVAPDVRSSLFQTLSTPADMPSLGELIALSCHRLVSYIQLSRFLPIYVKQAWIRQIRVIDLHRWQAGLAIVEELYFDHRCAQTDYRPGHDIFGDNLNQDQDFNAEMTCIEHELNTIEMILKYAEASAEDL